jgi:hypothetical protein
MFYYLYKKIKHLSIFLNHVLTILWCT